METLELIIRLVRAGVDGVRADFPEGMTTADWERLLSVCAAQHIHSFVFDALPETAVPEGIMDLWRSQVKENERADRLLTAVVNAQEKVWRERGLKYALLKGPSLAALYPIPNHRHCGDIDWWFADRNSWAAALELAERKAETETDSDGDINYVFESVTVEHHRDWTHLSSRKLRRWCGSPELQEGRLRPEDTLLSLICHILHHVAWDGVNLKQIVDLAVAFKAYEGAYDPRHLVSRLERLGLGSWTSLLSSILIEFTGISSSSLPLPPKCSDADRRRFLSVLLETHPALSTRLILMWRASKRECLARYWYLASGKIKTVFGCGINICLSF